MKTFLKTLLALALATTFLLTGCDTNDWQTVSCEVSLLSAVFIHEDGYTRLETSDTSEYQAISFKLPKEYYFTENRGEYNNENQKTWTDGESYFVIYGITLVNSDDFFMHKTELGLDKMMLKRTVLDNGIIDSLTYPRMHYENDERENFTDDEPTSHGHFVDVAIGDYVISFTVYEYCPLGSPVISDETIEFIQTIADSFRYEQNLVITGSVIKTVPCFAMTTGYAGIKRFVVVGYKDSLSKSTI